MVLNGQIGVDMRRIEIVSVPFRGSMVLNAKPRLKRGKEPVSVPFRGSMVLNTPKNRRLLTSLRVSVPFRGSMVLNKKSGKWNAADF